MLQVLHGNTALRHISLWSGRAFSDSAYCQARARLPLELFGALLGGLAATLADVLWRGYRVLSIDGPVFSMPDTPELQARFGQPPGQARGSGFPVAKILALFPASTGLLLEVAAAPPRSLEMARLDAVTPALQPYDVLVSDRILCSSAHKTMLVQRGIHVVFRVHQKQSIDFTPGRPHAKRGHDGAHGLRGGRFVRDGRLP